MISEPSTAVLTAPPARRAAPSTPSLQMALRCPVAYLTTTYPKVSHTFVRREILELERLGFSVLRLAIRDGGDAIADPVDREERGKTVHCLGGSPVGLLASLGVVALSRPRRWLAALAMTSTMARRSDRGLMRHLAYLVEACHLLRIVRARRIAHVHVHFGTNAASVARLLRCLGGPTYSMMVHGPDEFDAPRGHSLGAKVAEASFVTAISDFCSAQIRRWVGPEHWAKIHVVRCTVGQTFFDAAGPIDPGSRQLVCVGRLTPQKGQLLLLEAASILVREGLDLELVLAGDGELRPLVERRIDELNLRDHVRITGWIDEAQVRECLLQSRALVLPSFAEGLPVVIMEALALQRPVITTWIAGIPELVRPVENGWLIPAGNLPDLVEAMRDALAAPVERLQSMGVAGAQRVRDRHHTEGEVAKLADLLSRWGGREGPR